VQGRPSGRDGPGLLGGPEARLNTDLSRRSEDGTLITAFTRASGKSSGHRALDIFSVNGTFRRFLSLEAECRRVATNEASVSAIEHKAEAEDWISRTHGYRGWQESNRPSPQ